jgi:hypothetical protein
LHFSAQAGEFPTITSEPLRLDVNPQLECAETLASRYYTDPAMLSLEKERIFRRT